MKTQRVNPNAMNPMQMNNMSSMMGMMNSIQKIGKGKRKYSIMLDKNNKKFLAKFIDEVKKQFASSPLGTQGQGVSDFFDYVKKMCKDKNQMELKGSFEEYEFLKKMVIDSVKGMEAMEFKWYQLIKKGMIKMMVKQYRELLTKLK